MATKIQLFYDYVCPFCYLGEIPFEQAIQELDVEVELCPYELRRPPVPKTDPMRDEAKLKRFEEVLKPEAERLGVAMQLPWISPHPYTTLAFQGFYFAKEAGKQREYNHRVFHAFYVDEQDIGEMPVIDGILTEIGLNVDAFQRAVEDQVYMEALNQAKEYAKAQGVTSIPTFIIGNQRLTGIHSMEEFQAAISAADAAAEMGQVGMHCSLDGKCE